MSRGKMALVGKYCAMNCAMNICTRRRVEIPVNLTSARPFFLASNLQRKYYEFACRCKLLKTKRREEFCRKLPANRADFYARGRCVKGHAALRGRPFWAASSFFRSGHASPLKT